MSHIVSALSTTASASTHFIIVLGEGQGLDVLSYVIRLQRWWSRTRTQHSTLDTALQNRLKGLVWDTNTHDKKEQILLIIHIKRCCLIWVVFPSIERLTLSSHRRASLARLASQERRSIVDGKTTQGVTVRHSRESFMGYCFASMTRPNVFPSIVTPCVVLPSTIGD